MTGPDVARADLRIGLEMTAFAHRTVLVVAGKGGVGRTTVSAALARLAAGHDVSVLLVELEGKTDRARR